MQCTIELRTLNSISVPKLVSLVQNFLEPEDPSRKKFSVLARAACTPQEWQPEKHTYWGSIRVTCKFGTGGALRLACRGGKRTKGTKKLARALHVHTAVQSIKSYGAKYTLSRSTHLPSWVSLAKNFLAPEDPTSKKFSEPGACSLHPQERQPQKHTRWGCTRVTCKFRVGGTSRLACRVG